MNINALKNLSVRSGFALDELVAVRSELKLLAQNFDDLKMTIPEWVASKVDEVEAEVKSQMKAERQATLQKMRARRAALMTRDEKRETLDKEIAELEAQLA